tara:strand:+ start:2954 stop:4024 length:1071 start_codon:yes stop_codon:yes gene_type:complete
LKDNKINRPNYQFSKREELNELCYQLSLSSDLVQGAGGNISYKNDGTLWIKASGCWLSDALIKDIFLPVNLKHLRESIENNQFDVNPKIFRETNLRPSIETLFHALMPQKYVLHLHPIIPLSLLVRKDSEKFIQERLSKHLTWKMIDYRKPGGPLAKEIYSKIRYDNKIDILFLKNHGIILGGNSINELSDKLKIILSDLNDSAFSSNFSDNPITVDKSISVSKDISIFPIKKRSSIHQLVFEEEMFERISDNWALYPDHVVFLGAEPHCFDSIDNLLEKFRNKLFEDIPELLFIKKKGIYSKNKISKAKLVQLKCYYDVLKRQENSIELSCLSKDEIYDILNWDAEHYRQNIAKE